MRTYSRLGNQYQLIEGVQERCRLCLAKVTEKIPIFNETTNLCAPLAVRIMLCVGFEVCPDEGLPNYICTECSKELNQCIEFKKKCNLTHQKLQSHMKAVKLKEMQNTGVTDPNLTGSQIKVPGEKSQIAPKYENLVSDALSLTEHELPVQVIPNVIHPAVAENTQQHPAVVENTQMDTEEVPLKGKDTVIKSLPKHVTFNIPSPEPQPPDISEFLSSVLLELNVLNKNGDDILLKDSSLRTVEIETGDETVITLNVLQVEEEVPILIESNITTGGCEKNQSAATQAKTYSQPKCEQCGKTFASSSALRRHARVHSGERPYVCAVCNRGFAQKEVLARHELVHKEERPYKCLKCPKSFTQRKALDSHSRSHVAPNQRPLNIHSCSKCIKMFLHSSGLSRHMMTHNGRVFDCGICARRFTDHSSLLRHMRVVHRADQRPHTVIALNPSPTLQQGGGVCT